MRFARIAGLALALLVAWPAAARAVVDVSPSGGVITITGDSDGNSISVLTPAPPGLPADGKAVLIDIDSRTSSTAPTVTTGGECSAFNPAPGLTRVNCNLSTPLSMLNSTLGLGDDRHVHGSGNDRETHPYRLSLDLGDGNDELDISRRRAGVGASGGPGYDEVTYAGCNDCASGVTVNLGGGGTDSFGEFESVEGSTGPDHITGTARTSFPGAPLGNEVERIDGREGNDTILDGGGPDAVFADSGDDAVVSNDGVIDAVDCGNGSDTVQADGIDSVSFCEGTTVGVVITSGPSGTVTSREATFEFTTTTANPLPGHFECRIDTFGFAACTSPKTFTNLPDGAHRVEIRYVPDGGDPGPVAVRDWTVQASCPDVPVGLVKVQGCFTERLANGVGTGVFETENAAWIGGFHVVPRPGGKLVVQNDPTTPFVAEGAGVDWVLGPVVVPAPLGELKPFVGDFTFSVGTAGTLERFVALPFIKGFSAQLKVTWAGGGTGAKVETSVSMEELTKNLGKPLAGRLGLGGTSIGTLAAKLGLTFTNGKPAEVADGELEVPEFAVELKGTDPAIKEGFGGAKFKATNVAGTVEWSAEVSMLFPWQGNQGVVKGRLFFRAFEIAGGGLSVSGFERPIGRTGWDFTGVEGDILYRPSYSFNVGVTAQTRSSFAGVKLLKLTGNVKALRLAEADCGNGKNPVEFVGTFNSPAVEEADAGEFKGQVLMCAYLQGARNFAFEAGLSGELVADVGPFSKLFSATGSAKGWFSGTDFNLDGSYRLTAPGIGTIGADGVLSSEGYAICGRAGFISAGIATNNWLQAPEELVGCDFTPFRVATPSASAHTAQAARTIGVPAGQSAFGFAVRGTTGAPRVRISGPGGARVDSPPGGRALKGSRAMIIPIDELKTTYVYLRKPRAGAWRIVPVDAAGIRRIDTARELPRPSVRARVRRRGAKVEVTWRARQAPGRTIELVDRTSDGTAATIQKATSKGRGRVTFTPENPLSTRRTIEAAILQDGSPRPPLTAARYRLTRSRRPGRVTRPTARRAGGGLAVAWRRAPRAREYLVTVKAGAEVLTRTTTRRLRLTYAGAPAGTLTVEIMPRDVFGRSGPTTTLRAR